jgi:hypothetical protein
MASGAIAGLSSVLPLLALAGLGYLIYRRVQARAAIEATGYTAPVEWVKWLENPIEFKIAASTTYAGSDYGKKDRVKLVTPRLLAERSALPPFTLWYHQGDYAARPNPDADKWLSVVDGNATLAPVGGAMPVYVQRVEGKETGSKLALYQIAPEAAADLTRGPLRQIKLQAVRHSDRQAVILTLPAGVAGGVMPQTPRPMESRTTQGSSRAGTGDADAESA